MTCLPLHQSLSYERKWTSKEHIEGNLFVGNCMFCLYPRFKWFTYSHGVFCWILHLSAFPVSSPDCNPICCNNIYLPDHSHWEDYAYLNMSYIYLWKVFKSYTSQTNQLSKSRRNLDIVVEASSNFTSIFFFLALKAVSTFLSGNTWRV